MHAGAAERVDAHADAGAADRVEVDDVAEVGDVGVEVVVLGASSARGSACANGMRFTPVEPVVEQRVGAVLDPAA